MVTFLNMQGIMSPPNYAANQTLLAETPLKDSANIKVKLHDRVIIDQYKLGVVRFIGPTSFKEGIWAGVELDLPLGKNDGSVEGIRYFTCLPKKGLFINPEKLVLANASNSPSKLNQSALQSPSKISVKTGSLPGPSKIVPPTSLKSSAFRMSTVSSEDKTLNTVNENMDRYFMAANSENSMMHELTKRLEDSEMEFKNLIDLKQHDYEKVLNEKAALSEKCIKLEETSFKKEREMEHLKLTCLRFEDQTKVLKNEIELIKKEKFAVEEEKKQLSIKYLEIQKEYSDVVQSQTLAEAALIEEKEFALSQLKKEIELLKETNEKSLKQLESNFAKEKEATLSRIENNEEIELLQKQAENYRIEAMELKNQISKLQLNKVESQVLQSQLNECLEEISDLKKQIDDLNQLGKVKLEELSQQHEREINEYKEQLKSDFDCEKRNLIKQFQSIMMKRKEPIYAKKELDQLDQEISSLEKIIELKESEVDCDSAEMIDYFEKCIKYSCERMEKENLQLSHKLIGFEMEKEKMGLLFSNLSESIIGKKVDLSRNTDDMVKLVMQGVIEKIECLKHELELAKGKEQSEQEYERLLADYKENEKMLQKQLSYLKSQLDEKQESALQTIRLLEEKGKEDSKRIVELEKLMNPEPFCEVCEKVGHSTESCSPAEKVFCGICYEYGNHSTEACPAALDEVK